MGKIASHGPECVCNYCDVNDFQPDDIERTHRERATHTYFNQSVFVGSQRSGHRFDVSSHYELADGIRGTVRFSGKTYHVQFNELNVTWHVIPASQVRAERQGKA